MDERTQISAEELNAKQSECLERLADFGYTGKRPLYASSTLKVDEAAEILDCTPKYVRKLCKAGVLHYYYTAHRYLILPDSIEAYIENRQTGNIKRKISLENIPVIKWHFISRQGNKNPLQTVQADKVTGYLEEISDLVQRITYEAAMLKAVCINYTTKRLYARIIPNTGATLDIQIARRADIKNTVQQGELQPLEAKPNKRRKVHRERDEKTGRYT